MKTVETKRLILIPPAEAVPKNEQGFSGSWQITLRKTGETVGELHFFGPPKDGEAEIHFVIAESHRRQGYAAEAVQAAMHWAFQNPQLYFILGKVDIDDEASMRALEKLGFNACGSSENCVRFEKERPASAHLGTYLCIYTGLGLCFGAALKNVALGLCIGVALGLSLGVTLDANDKKKRKVILEARARRSDAEKHE